MSHERRKGELLPPVRTRAELPQPGRIGAWCWVEDELWMYIDLGVRWQRLGLGRLPTAPPDFETADAKLNALFIGETTKRLRENVRSANALLSKEGWTHGDLSNARQYRTKLCSLCDEGECRLMVRAGQSTSYIQALRQAVLEAQEVMPALEAAERLLVDDALKFTGTVTGRLSCAQSNIQNIPRRLL